MYARKKSDVGRGGEKKKNLWKEKAGGKRVTSGTRKTSEKVIDV